MIGRLKPPLDFYYAYGTWIVRYYPKHIHQPGTPPQVETWDAMLEAVDFWNGLGSLDKQAWTNLVRNAMRTGKDFFYRVYLKSPVVKGFIWHNIKVLSFHWYANYVLIITQPTTRKQWSAYYVNQDKQHSTFYWKDEGYCIRGRRMSVKRNLIEQWSNYVNQYPFCLVGRTCYRIPVSAKDKSLYITFVRRGPHMIRDRGRTGVYITRR